MGYRAYKMKSRIVDDSVADNSRDIYILQAKGAFTALLNGGENPVISKSSRWESLPKFSFHALRDLVVPAPIRLNKNEVGLEEGIIINLDDLYSNRVDQTTVDRILSRDRSTRLALSSSASKNKRKHEDWLRKQQSQEVKDVLFTVRRNVSSAQLIFNEIYDAKTTCSPDRLASLRKKLREAHKNNMEEFIRSCETEAETTTKRRMSIEFSHTVSSTPLSKSRALSTRRPSEYYFTVSENSSVARKTGSSSSWVVVYDPETDKSQAAPDSTRHSAVTAVSDDSLHNLIWTPGFRIASPNAFLGDCPFCEISGAPMTVIMSCDETQVDERPLLVSTDDVDDEDIDEYRYRHLIDPDPEVWPLATGHVTSEERMHPMSMFCD
ncbi:hypothetical protein B0H63DRAFT_547545 [Podospora didyma]|uniref:Uncharacterized protein n=1 Tax=Podospora didyma TaxID=330526 RepID=A0AAE0KK46_9PEZI|nr:hypothetical protein B0H63DRAFT_547545 [Podospora didyma]